MLFHRKHSSIDAMITSMFNTNGDGNLGPTQWGDLLKTLSTLALLLLLLLLLLTAVLLLPLTLLLLLLLEFLYNDDKDSLAFLSSEFLALISEGNYCRNSNNDKILVLNIIITIPSF